MFVGLIAKALGSFLAGLVAKALAAFAIFRAGKASQAAADTAAAHQEDVDARQIEATVAGESDAAVTADLERLRQPGANSR